MKYRLILTSILSIVLIFQSCDEIDAPYLTETGELVAQKTILIEEFTGHQCPNCPGAAQAIEDLVGTYGDRIVIVAVHTNFNGQPNANFPADYRTAVGNELDSKFKMEESGLPKSMVNRNGFPELTHRIKSDELAGKVSGLISGDPLLDVRINRSYNAAERKVILDVNVSVLEKMQRKLILSVFITESNIISPQKNNNPDIGTTPQIDDYKHNHVLRGAVNGTWGDILCQGNQIPVGITYSRAYQHTLDTGWKEDDCSLVAFVYDGDTYEVLQAAEIHIK